jgi:hypothetical protein
MDEEIKLKKPGKGRTAVQFHRNSILNSGTKLANQAAVIAPKTNIVGRSYLTNDYLTQAKTPKIPKSLFFSGFFNSSSKHNGRWDNSARSY